MEFFELGKGKKKSKKEPREEREETYYLFKVENLIPWIVATAFAIALNDIIFSPLYSLVHFIVTGENSFNPESFLTLIVSVTLMITIGLALNKILLHIKRRKEREME